MDADTRLNDSAAGTEKGVKAITKARTAQRFLVNTMPRALALEETSADSHTRVWIPSSAARATKARKRTARGDEMR